MKARSIDCESRPTLKDESGMALLVAIVVAVLLTLIGLSLTSSSMTELWVTTEFEAYEKASIIADAAFNLARDDLRGKDLTVVLSTPTPTPRFRDYTEPEEGSYAARNPITPLEARSINFDNPPYPLGVRNAYGLLTPPLGLPLGGGRYFASVSDNEDEAPLGLPEDYRVDSDYTIYMRVMGVHRGMGREVGDAERGGKNSIAILEGLLRRDLSFDLASPMTLYGPDVTATFNGNAFDLVGDDEHPAVTVLNNDEANGDAQTAYQSMLDAIANKGHVEGESGPDGVSIQDGTQEVRDSENPDATNVFDPLFLLRFIQYLAAVADSTFTEDAHFSGEESAVFGTPENPEITVAQGDLILTGDGVGAGVLVVQGALDVGGSFHFDGIVLVVGEGVIDMHGANKDLVGGVYVARIEGPDENGNYTFGIPDIYIQGNSNFIFDSENLRMAINLLPFKTLSMREITPEVEPRPANGTPVLQ